MFGHSPKITHTTAYEGISPAGFLQAVRENNFEIVLKYIKQGSGIRGNLDIRDSKGQAAVSIAAEMGFLKILNALIDNGANLNAADECNETALHKAVKSGKHEVVHTLAAARDIDLEVKAKEHRYGPESKTALHLAVEKGHAEIVEILISHGAQINDYYALHIVAKQLNHTEVLKYLSENKVALLEIARRQYAEDCSESSSDSDDEPHEYSQYRWK